MPRWLFLQCHPQVKLTDRGRDVALAVSLSRLLTEMLAVKADAARLVERLQRERKRMQD